MATVYSFTSLPASHTHDSLLTLYIRMAQHQFGALRCILLSVFCFVLVGGLRFGCRPKERYVGLLYDLLLSNRSWQVEIVPQHYKRTNVVRRISAALAWGL